MATILWRGDSTPIPQVDTVTLGGTPGTADTVTLTINGKNLILTVGTDVTLSQVATNVKEMVNGETITGTAADATTNTTGPQVGEFSELTATVSGAVVSLTMDSAKAGKPFVLTESVTGGGVTAVAATLTASNGPNDAGISANYTGGVLPANGDDLWFQDSDVDCLYNLDAITGVTLATLHFEASFTGKVGLPYYDESNANPYIEYRPRYLAVGATIESIGDKTGDGSSRIMRDHEGVQTALTVYFTDTSDENNQFGAVEIINAGASSTIQVLGGTVDVAPRDDDVATFVTIIVDGGVLRCGANVTHTTATVNDGVFATKSAITTVNQFAGNVSIQAAATVTTINANGGGLVYTSSGTITTLNMGPNNATTLPVVDFSQDGSGRTVTDVNLNRGSILDPNSTVTWTNGVQPGTGVAAA